MTSAADPTAADLAAIEQEGFVVIPRLLTPAELAALRAGIAPHLTGELRGRNDFEGVATERVYSLVGRGPAFEALVEHPRILAICDALLQPSYLLTASQAINILPGETPQGLHTDDAFYAIPRPRKAISVSTIWAIDDFTVENGATEIIPGSHAWSDAEIEQLLRRIDFRTQPPEKRIPGAPPPMREDYERQLVPATMPAGSVIVFLGTLLHRGGANQSGKARLAMSNQYCEPWARQQENYTLAIPPARVRTMPPRVQQMLGYSIHPPFMGHILGVHPRRLLEPGSDVPTL